MARCWSSAARSLKSSESQMPALLIRTSRDSTWPAARCTCAASVTSRASGVTRASGWARGWRVPAYTRVAPLRRASSTSARPMPRLPPVTRTVLSAIVTMVTVSSSLMWSCKPDKPVWLGPARCPKSRSGAPNRSRRSGAWRSRSVLTGQHEHRNLPRDLGLEFADGRGLRDQRGPQRGAGGVGQLLRQDRERLGTHLDRDPGVGLEVVVPAWVGWRSSVGGGGREPAVGLREAAQRGHALDPGFGADVVNENQRDARPGPADASLVRPELLNDLGVVVASPTRSRVRHGLLQRTRSLAVRYSGCVAPGGAGPGRGRRPAAVSR